MQEDLFDCIGKKTPRVDARQKVTGKAVYMTDIKLPGMLTAKIKRSPYAHARIKKINTEKALQIPGVCAIITAKDIPQKGLGSVNKDEYILALDKVRFAGEGVAAVAAINAKAAEEALRLIEVEYEELAVVLDPEQAILPTSIRIHDKENNIAFSSKLLCGDVAKGFAEADYIFEHKFQTSQVAHCCMEPRVSIAHYELGKLTIWANTQNVFNLRKGIGEFLNIPQQNLRVIQPVVGGAFGARGEPFPVDIICAILSQKTGKPVKCTYSREEEFTVSRTRHPNTIWLKTGVKKDGAIVARQARIIVDNGACTSSAVMATAMGNYMASTLYNIPHILHEWDIVYTNKEPGGAFRGYGNPQIAFAVESQLDIIAKEIHMDPLDIRLKNAVSAGQIAPTGAIINSCGLRECLLQAAEKAGWDRQAAKKYGSGMGVACMVHPSGGRVPPFSNSDCSSAIIKLNEDGTANLLVGDSDVGQGSDTALSKIAAETLGIHYEQVKILSADTEVSPMCRGTNSSRVTAITGNAVYLAATEVREKLIKTAGAYFGATEENILIKKGRVIDRLSGKDVSVEEIAKAAAYQAHSQPIFGYAYFDGSGVLADPQTGQGNMSISYSFGAQIAEVEVDCETGKVEVTRFVSAIDVGKVIDPLCLEGQIEGGVVQGIGYALTEDMKFAENGVIKNPSFRDYKILGAMDVGCIENIAVETNDCLGPYGAKGVAEATIVGVAPAITNAIFNALGTPVYSIPVTPAKIKEMIQI